jgi:GNAT superfamily N-acetyltransferase
MSKLNFKRVNVRGQLSTVGYHAEALLRYEWPGFSFKDSYKLGSDLPSVIVAFEGKLAVGTLAFTRYKEPQGSGEVIWINALAVASQYQGRGIASQLIELGCKEVESFSQPFLYVYTDIPKLYTKLGWIKLDEQCEPNHFVLRFEIKKGEYA